MKKSPTPFSQTKIKALSHTIELKLPLYQKHFVLNQRKINPRPILKYYHTPFSQQLYKTVEKKWRKMLSKEENEN